MSQFFTPLQVARALGVSESTLKRWCDKGVLPTVRTAGGHRRVTFEAVAEYVRQSGQELVRPEVLGLPPAAGQGATVRNRAVRQLVSALRKGDGPVVARIIADLYLTKHPIWQIGDEVVAPTLAEIGHAWECGELPVYRERLGCEIAQRALFALQDMVPQPPADAPTAIGGTLDGDPYRLATTLCESVLREAGWRAQSLGTAIPPESFCDALRDLQPRICWLSVSHAPDAELFVAQMATIAAAAKQSGAALVVGGRGFTEEFRRRCDYTVYCERLKDLRSFADSLMAASDAALNSTAQK
jgi:excisionase family DNA binding protein